MKKPNELKPNPTGEQVLAMLSRGLREEIGYRMSIRECECPVDCPDDGSCPNLATTLSNFMWALEDLEDSAISRKEAAEILELHIKLGTYRPVPDQEYNSAQVLPASAKRRAYFKHKGIRYTFERHIGRD